MVASARLLSLLALCGASHADELHFGYTRCHGGASGCALSNRRRQQQLPLQRQRQQQQQQRGFVVSQERHAGLANALRLQGGFSSEQLKMPLAFTGWYLMSIIYSVLNKEVLNVWKFPVAWSAVQLLVGSIFVALLWTPLPTLGMRGDDRKLAPIREPPKLTWSEIGTVSGVAVWLALGHVMSTVSPAYGTVAFTNVVKTLEPLFTCLFSALFLKQIFALPVYLSLLPVIFGVALASANEVSFSMISLISGLLSNVCFAMRAISAKKLMSKPVGENMNAQNLYAVLTFIALFTILPLAFLAEGRTLVAGTQATIASIGLPRFLRMVALTGISHYT